MTERIQVTREGDGETIGVLVADGDQWRPETVFGGVLGDPTDRDAAEELIHRLGMASLADRWWIRPADGSGDWAEYWLTEVKPDAVRVQPSNPLYQLDGHGRWLSTTDHEVRRHHP